MVLYYIINTNTYNSNVKSCLSSIDNNRSVKEEEHGEIQEVIVEDINKWTEKNIGSKARRPDANGAVEANNRCGAFD